MIGTTIYNTGSSNQLLYQKGVQKREKQNLCFMKRVPQKKQKRYNLIPTSNFRTQI